MQRKQTCLMFFKEEFHNVLLLQACVGVRRFKSNQNFHHTFWKQTPVLNCLNCLKHFYCCSSVECHFLVFIYCMFCPTHRCSHIQGIKWTRDAQLAKVYFSTLWPLVLTTSPQFTFAGFVYLKKKNCKQLNLWRPTIKNLSRHSLWDHGETCTCCPWSWNYNLNINFIYIFIFCNISQYLYIRASCIFFYIL